MSLSRNEAQSLKLADQLEAQIRSSVLTPGNKLLSTRALSEKFQLDRNIVRAALEKLENRKLIVSEPRKGFYVNPELLSLGRPELYLFTFGGFCPSYLETALEIFKNREYQKKFNVTIRYSSWMELNQQTFENEMLKAKLSTPGMIVLAGTYVDREKLELLRKNNIPFIILGELHHDLPEIHFNQICERFAEKGVAVGKFFAESKFKEIAYFSFPNHMLEYEKTYKDAIRSAAMNSGKKYNEAKLRFDPVSEVNTHECQARAVKKLFASGARPDLLHFIDSVDVASLQKTLAPFKLRIPEDVNIIVYEQLYVKRIPGLYEITVDYHEFARKAFELIEEFFQYGKAIGKMDLSHLVSCRIHCCLELPHS